MVAVTHEKHQLTKKLDYLRLLEMLQRHTIAQVGVREKWNIRMQNDVNVCKRVAQGSSQTLPKQLFCFVFKMRILGCMSQICGLGIWSLEKIPKVADAIKHT